VQRLGIIPVLSRTVSKASAPYSLRPGLPLRERNWSVSRLQSAKIHDAHFPEQQNRCFGELPSFTWCRFSLLVSLCHIRTRNCSTELHLSISRRRHSLSPFKTPESMCCHRFSMPLFSYPCFPSGIPRHTALRVLLRPSQKLARHQSFSPLSTKRDVRCSPSFLHCFSPDWRISTLHRSEPPFSTGFSLFQD